MPQLAKELERIANRSNGFERHSNIARDRDRKGDRQWILGLQLPQIQGDVLQLAQGNSKLAQRLLRLGEQLGLGQRRVRAGSENPRQVGTLEPLARYAQLALPEGFQEIQVSRLRLGEDFLRGH